MGDESRQSNWIGFPFGPSLYLLILIIGRAVRQPSGELRNKTKMMRREISGGSDRWQMVRAFESRFPTLRKSFNREGEVSGVRAFELWDWKIGNGFDETGTLLRIIHLPRNEEVGWVSNELELQNQARWDRVIEFLSLIRLYHAFIASKLFYKAVAEHVFAKESKKGAFWEHWKWTHISLEGPAPRRTGSRTNIRFAGFRWQ